MTEETRTTRLKIIGTACAVALLSAGTTSAAPMMHQNLGTRAPSVTLVRMTGSSTMGKRMQRHRTRTTRCNNAPARR